jgi:hypothetical protein
MGLNVMPSTCDTVEKKLSYCNRAMKKLTEQHNINAATMPLDEFRIWQEGKYKEARTAIGNGLVAARLEATAKVYPKGYVVDTKDKGAVYAYYLSKKDASNEEIASAHINCEKDSTWDTEIETNVIASV